MARVGKRNKAQFRIVLQQSTAAPGGRHVEVLGSYDPHRKIAVLKEEKIKNWISKGAQTSDTVHNLLVSKGIIQDKKRAVRLPARDASHSDADGPKKEVPAENTEVAGAKEEKAEEEMKEEKTEEKKEEVEETKEEPKVEEKSE